ncbi:MAG: methylthioribulose 1-phosphate dehydratase [Gammaproteobacteria bacterium]
MSEFHRQAASLIDAGRLLYGKGMVPATSGNFSARLANGNLAITVSGAHKGRLTQDDIMEVDAAGRSLDSRRPSAETLLHVVIYRRYPTAHMVLHPHSAHATVLSRLCGDALLLQDYELLKAFPGVDTHACTVSVPVLDNDQDMTRLAARVDAALDGLENAHGFLIRGHGFYTWGETIAETLRHVEAFEFLFVCELMEKRIRS